MHDARAPQRLLFVNHSMRMGGIETMIRDFALGLPRAAWQPEVAVFSGGGVLGEQLAAGGMPVTDLHKREGLDPGLVLRLRRLLRTHGISVVHSHNYSAWLYSVLATWGLPGVRLVHTEHSRIEPLPRRQALVRWLARRSSAVVGVSLDVTRSLVEEAGAPADRVGFIANGIDLARFRPDPALRAAARQELGIAVDAAVFGIVARLVPVKSHRTLVDAFAIVRASRPDARLLLAGDGPCRAELEAQVAAAGLGGAVRFLGEVRDTPRVLNALDVYMLSSVDEGMNLTLLEAMACGLPVVATAVGGNGEVVHDGRTGRLVPRLDALAMAERMLELAADAGARERLGDAGRARVEHDFSQAATMRAYEALYRGGRWPGSPA